MYISTLNPAKSELIQAVKAMELCEEGSLTPLRAGKDVDRFEIIRLISKIRVDIKDGAGIYTKNGRKNGDCWGVCNALFCKFSKNGKYVDLDLGSDSICVIRRRIRVLTRDVKGISYDK